MVNRTKRNHHKREKHKRGKHKRGKHKTYNQKRRNQVGGKKTRDGEYDPNKNYVLLLLLGESEIPFNIYIPAKSMKINKHLNITGYFYIIKLRDPENKNLPIEVNHLTPNELQEEKDATQSEYKKYVIDYLLDRAGGNYGDWKGLTRAYGVLDLFKFIDAGLTLYNYGYYECFNITNKKGSINWLKNKKEDTDGHCIYPETYYPEKPYSGKSYGSQDMRYKLHISVKKEFIGDAVTKFQEYFNKISKYNKYIYNYKIIIPDFRHSEYKTVDGAKKGYDSLPDEYKKYLLPAAANIVIYPSTNISKMTGGINGFVSDFKYWWVRYFENTYTDAARDENYMMFNFRIPGTRTLFFAYGADTDSRLYGEDGYTFIEPSVIKNLKEQFCSRGSRSSSTVPACLKDSLNIDESNYDEFCSNEAFHPANQSLGARFGMSRQAVGRRQKSSTDELSELDEICDTGRAREQREEVERQRKRVEIKREKKEGNIITRALKKCWNDGTCTTQQPLKVDLDASIEMGKMKHKKSKRKSRSKRKKKTRKPKNSRKPRKPKQTKRKKKNK